MKQNTNPQEPRGSGNNRGFNLFNIISILFLITFIFNVFISRPLVNQPIQISYSQFLKLVEGGQVAQVELNEMEIRAVLKTGADDGLVRELVGSHKTLGKGSRGGQQIFYTGRIDDPHLVQFLDGHNVEFYKPIIRVSPILSFMSRWVFPVVMMYFLYSFVLGRLFKKMAAGGMMGGMGGVGKSKAKMYTVEESTGKTFADVAGQNEAKESLEEMVDYLRNPEVYKKIGAKQPKGALLVGPPGTGKTLLAQAVAGEAGLPFYSLSGSEFVEMFVGVGASRVRDLFAEAKKHAPCIVFIDEIDAIGKTRDNQLGGNDEREQTLNQLLAEMDGFSSGEGILVLAATNRPEILDKALLRPGRFDRRIIVDKPDLPGREAILKVHASKVVLGENVDLPAIALMTSGATGADLANCYLSY